MDTATVTSLTDWWVSLVLQPRGSWMWVYWCFTGVWKPDLTKSRSDLKTQEDTLKSISCFIFCFTLTGTTFLQNNKVVDQESGRAFIYLQFYIIRRLVPTVCGNNSQTQTDRERHCMINCKTNLHNMQKKPLILNLNLFSVLNNQTASYSECSFASCWYEFITETVRQLKKCTNRAPPNRSSLD